MARAWLLTCGALAAGSLAGWWLPAAALDWQPVLAPVEPWRFVTAAWVHWSALHLVANLAGVVVVAALGQVARLPIAPALALAAAWPLTHAGLLLQPALARYGGASGVLHAAVAVAACWLIVARRGRQRGIGAAIAVGLALKLLLERPWQGPLAQPAGWDIAVAPAAHLSGALAGLSCALATLGALAVSGGLGAAGPVAPRRHRQSPHER
jgi:rhomboid family GlyGly-CTERM serine protease